VNKFLNKIASLLKNKRLVSKIQTTGSTSSFSFLGKGKDVDSFDRVHALHSTVQRQQAAGAPAVKHRLQFEDGSQAFIRGSSKGIKTRLYRE
jgi:hypothetical protein